MRRLPFAALLVICLAACGDDNGGSPVNPGPPPLPNYTGIWNGTSTATGCTQSGFLVIFDICGSFAPGTTGVFQLNLIQQGATITNGNFTLGTLAFNVNPAALNTAGGVSVSGTTNSGTVTIFSTWNLSSPIVGTRTDVWSASGVSGQATVSLVIGSTVKTGSQIQRPMLVPRTVPELLDAIRAVE